ncbi:uncharacterized protein LOC114724917 [Neltuma alba]|uniref:uncharacterized protein LOC114724917 n=1 Tax=Neltuma alba TaxID=207710 RepID=UPI0010A2FB45|nr:uncharacterized protein LOC114724917 [Prosopis alba]
MEASKSASVKQLKEHLQHQQEPFSLHNYLSERSFFLKNFSSHIDDGYHVSSSSSSSSEKTLKWQINYEKHNIRKRFFHASSSILRSLFNRFVPLNDHQNHQKLSTKWVATDAASDEDGEEDDGLICHDYSPKLVNMFHSFTLPEFRRLQVDAGAKPSWISTVEKKWEQPFANSVCEFKSEEGPETAIYTLSQKPEGEPFFSTYLPKLLLNPNILKFRRQKRDKLHHHVVHGSKGKHEELLGRAEKARGFQENKGKRGKIWLLEKRCSRETQNITNLLHADSCVVSKVWTNLQRPSRDIHFEIGDAIMDDILKEMLSILVIK